MPARRTAALLVLLLAAPAAAADRSGFSIAVGGAYAVPRGDLDGDGPALEDVVASRVPIWGEVGYRFSRVVRLHVLLELSPDGLVEEECAAGAECSVSGLRLGLALQLHLPASPVIDPWIGVGVGIETLDTRRTDETGELRVRWAGFEAPLLLAGIDVRLGSRAAIGPFVVASHAEYTSFREERDGGVRDVRVEPRAGHRWLQAGLRLRVDL